MCAACSRLSRSGGPRGPRVDGLAVSRGPWHRAGRGPRLAAARCDRPGRAGRLAGHGAGGPGAAGCRGAGPAAPWRRPSGPAQLRRPAVPSRPQACAQACQHTRHPFRLNIQSNTGGAAVPADLAAYIAEQEAIFTARQPESARLAAQAAGVLAGGVTSSWQITRPQPVWLSHGRGSRIIDVDGNEYVDLHGGYGAALAGHAHPAIVSAVTEQVTRGTHFAQPTAAAIDVARELATRFGLPQWRFANSGTEATMDAVHLMREITGRDLIIKVEGCYHGHHDSVQVSVCPDPDEIKPEPSSI